MRRHLALLLPLLPDKPCLPKDQWRVVELRVGELYYYHPVRGEPLLIEDYSVHCRVLACVTLRQVSGEG